MSPLTIERLEASYAHVESAEVVQMIAALLEISSGPWGRTSVVMGSPESHTSRNLLELQGLGGEIWVHVDVPDYLNELRNEWDPSR